MSARHRVSGSARALVRLGLVSVLATGGAVVGLAGAPALASTDTTSAVTKSVTATRTVLAGGKERELEPARTVSLTVQTTVGLRDRQSIAVSWKGAHPSGNTDYDANSSAAPLAEYPMVLLQCRGTDTAAAPISPTTCWAPWGGVGGVRNQASPDSPIGAYPAWRLDRYADIAKDRQQFSGFGSPVPVPVPADSVCPVGGTVAQHNLPFLGADGTVYEGTGSDDGCGKSPPEAATFATANSLNLLPDNATFAGSDAEGNGQALFNVRDAGTNSSLGCSSTVTCSLVAVPVVGISCDESGSLLPVDQQPRNDRFHRTLVDSANAACEATASTPIGSTYSSNNSPSYAVTGDLWWSASNWRNRISVPLSFAPAASGCSLGGPAAAPVYGSELLVQATNQWGAALCGDPSQAGFKHVQTPEPQARNLLEQGLVHAAFGSEPPATPFSTPTVQAPVAATGFAISFSIDDADRKPVTTLRMTARLLAKLMTESYPVRPAWAQGYTYTNPPNAAPADPLATNPLDITQDPEFEVLNPGVSEQVNHQGVGALLALSSQSDVMYALTSYLNADPEARAWLDGQPDPWGMVVNPNYKGVALPVISWPQLDAWAPAANPSAEGNVCDRIDPQPPPLGLVAAPLSRLVDIAQSTQYAVSNEQTYCEVLNDPSGNNVTSYRYTRLGKMPPGFRFLISVTSLGDAQRYALHTAQLQSHVADSAPAKFTDAAGRDFVAPTDASLKAAASHLKFDSTTTTWPVPYDELRTDAAAYPGFMLVYADVPTTGLAAGDAAAYARLLTYAAGPGQQPGADVGQLPAGFLPITSDNGLGALADFTKQAAASVAAQKGSGSDQTPTASVSASAPGAAVAFAASEGSAGQPAGAAAPPAGTANTPIGAAKPAALATGTTRSDTSDTWTVLFVLLVVALGLGPVGVPVMLGVRRWRVRR